MKSSAWSFGGVAIFIFIATIVYWFMSHEIVGTVALIMALLMCVMVWGYLLLTLRSMGTPPLEDVADATIEQGAGVIGFFPPSSIWPFWAALSASVFVLGPVFGWYMSILGAALGFWALIGWVYQYYVGDYKH